MQIHPVIRMEQRGEPIYQFYLTVQQLMEVGRVERFEETPSGVQRKLDPKHVDEMVNAMIEDPQTLFLEPIVGDLVGNWKYDPKQLTLSPSGGAYITIDDGGHRFEAFKVLNPEEASRWQISVIVTNNLPFERRIKLFRQQMERKRIDPRLTLAQRYRLGDWENKLDQECYELCVALNGATDSPLKGMILLDEQLKQPYEHRHRPVGVNVTGLMSTFRVILGKNSPLARLSPDKRREVVFNYLRLAKLQWPDEWESTKHVLTSAKGLRPLLMLLSASPNFRGALGDDFSQANLEQVLRLADSYNWTETHNRKRSIPQIITALDQAIGRNAAKL